MDIEIRKQLEQLEYIKDKLEYIEYSESLQCYVEKLNGIPTGVAAWVNGAFYGFEQAAKAQAVPDSPTEKTWDEIHLDPKERLYWSLRSAKKRKSDLNWSHASHQTCVGSTHGRKICEYLGVDPDGKDFVKTQEPAND